MNSLREVSVALQINGHQQISKLLESTKELANPSEGVVILLSSESSTSTPIFKMFTVQETSFTFSHEICENRYLHFQLCVTVQNRR